MNSGRSSSSASSSGVLGKGLRALCLWLCKRLAPREIGVLFERLQIALADEDPRVGHYALEFNNPQALCFLMDAYPTLQGIFATYPRMGTVRLLDIGPAFGASAGLLSQMHRSHFLGPKVVVDVLDIYDSRRKFIEMSYPLVNFMHASIESLPGDAKWDVVYCSNAIEHMENPRAFVQSVMEHTSGHAMFLAPYNEALPLSEDHRSQITEQTFDGFAVEAVKVFTTAAWPMTADGVRRQQILVVIKAQAQRGLASVADGGEGPSPALASRAADHWDRWQAAHDSQRPRMTDWGDHPEVLRLIGAELLGSADTSIVGFLAGRLGARQAHAMSLCCGDGSFEKALLAGGVFRTIEGLDISEVRIGAARAAAGEQQGRLTFRACDIDAADFGEAVCDAVVAKAALHHLSRLEELFDGIARCLRPGGVLVTLDFFGPTRFQWTDRQLDEANRFLETEVPEELRRLPDGSLYRATRPTVQEMIEMDPSEAVRSADLLPLLRERFEPELDLPLGGTLLSLILHGSIVDNFEPGNEAHDAIVRKAFALERRLMAEDAIGSDFRLIIARPKSAPTH